MKIPTSIDELIFLKQSYGALNVMWENGLQSGTSATTIAQSAYFAQRLRSEWVMPAVTAPVVGALVTELFCSNVSNVITGLEYTLARWDKAGTPQFTAPQVMPSKVIRNAAASQMVANYLFMVVETVIASFAANVTITYTNQDGTSGRTMTFTIATSTAINTCYWLAPFLQAGDTGIISIQNVVVAATQPTGGKFSIRGVLPFNTSTGTMPQSLIGNPLMNPVIEPGEMVAQYRLATSQTATGSAHLTHMHLTPIT